MECIAVAERIAAYLDGQLGAAETEQVDTHLERCETCAETAAALGEQRFAPLDASEKSRICDADGFWSGMEDRLGRELAAMDVRASPLPVWHRRRVRLPVPMVMAYAAALLLAVAWGVQHQQRSAEAEQVAKRLGQQLEQERRLAAQPKSPQRPTGTSTYRVVKHTPQRGTF